MTLIEMVREARIYKCLYIAIDKDRTPYFYDNEPYTIKHRTSWDYKSGYCRRATEKYNLTCDWRDTLIEVSKIKEKG